jgi:hypothetical protein
MNIHRMAIISKTSLTRTAPTGVANQTKKFAIQMLVSTLVGNDKRWETNW